MSYPLIAGTPLRPYIEQLRVQTRFKATITAGTVHAYNKYYICN